MVRKKRKKKKVTCSYLKEPVRLAGSMVALGIGLAAINKLSS